MKIVVFKITGAPCGMLMNNPAAMETPAGNGKVKAPKVYLTGKTEADTKAYKDEKGFLRAPAMAYRLALIQGAKGRKVGKAFASNLITGCVFPAEQWVRLLDAKTGKPKKDYDVHTEPVVVNDARVPRSRPLVTGWSGLLALELDDELIGEETVLELLNLAGKTVGVGDHRPVFGRFSAELV